MDEGRGERVPGNGGFGRREKSHDLKQRAWRETKTLLRIAVPSTVFRVTSYGTVVLAQSFIGHLGDLELSAYALLQTIFIRFINGLLAGMSSATETLCGQAYGAGQYHMMGIYLQRSWIVDGATSTLFVPLLLLAGPILSLLGQSNDITALVQTMSPWFIPYLYYLVFSTTIQMYMLAQMKNAIVGWLSTLSLLLELLLSWWLVTEMGFGLGGAVWALNVASWAMVLGGFAYVFGGWCPLTWRGFSMAAFLDLWPVLKLSISSGFMVCLEVWYFSVLVLIAGYTKDAKIDISAFSICQYIYVWEYCICIGFMSAACVRVANELGRGDAESVKFSIKVNLIISTCIGVIFSLLCLVFRRQISYLFSDSEEVATVVEDLSLLLAFSILINSIQPILSGVAVGSGLQSLVAYVNLGSYYGIGTPTGIGLAYFANLGVKGLWIGMLGGVVVQTLVLSYIINNTDWDDQVKKAQERLNTWLLVPSTSSEDPDGKYPTDEQK